MTIDGAVTGLGSYGPNTKFHGYVKGYLETVCINGGSETPPGQNKNPLTLTGSVQGTADADRNGAYAYDLSMSENCSCGKEIGTAFEAEVGKGKDKMLDTFFCGIDPQVDLKGDGGVCCDEKRDEDVIDCGGEYFHAAECFSLVYDEARQLISCIQLRIRL